MSSFRLTSTAKFLSLFLAAFTAAFASSARAQQSTTQAGSVSQVISNAGIQSISDNPVVDVRTNRRWEYGPFLNWGTGVGDRSNYKFFWGGVQLGKPLTPVLGHGFFAGQFELGANIMPLWQAYTPAPHDVTFVSDGTTYTYPVGGGTFRGVSLTPVIFRWNFLTHSHRIQPWFQAAGGLIYTTHKFPPDILVPHGDPGGTSVWNFAPQGGVGIHYFTRPGRSIDLGVNAVHISSSSLGDRNPGVNASIQIQVGYTFWK